MIDYKLAVIAVVICLLFCLLGSLYEEYIVEKKISRKYFNRLGNWVFWMFK